MLKKRMKKIDRHKKTMCIHRNYYGLSNNTIDDLFKPIINFFEDILKGNDLDQDQDNMPVIYLNESDPSDIKSALALSVEYVYQCKLIQHGISEESNNIIEKYIKVKDNIIVNLEQEEAIIRLDLIEAHKFYTSLYDYMRTVNYKIVHSVFKGICFAFDKYITPTCLQLREWMLKLKKFNHLKEAICIIDNKEIE